MHRICAFVAALGTATAALAAPVELVIGEASDGFDYNTFHAADGGCADEAGDTWCMTGSWTSSLEGTLIADLQADGSLTSIHGTITFDVSDIPEEFQAAGLDGSLEIIAGTIDLNGDGDSGSVVSFLEFENGMTIYFPDRPFRGSANTFDGNQLYLRGNSWDALALQTRGDVKLALGMDLAAKRLESSAPVPEPASLGLLAAGGLIVGTVLRRPLKD